MIGHSKNYCRTFSHNINGDDDDDDGDDDDDEGGGGDIDFVCTVRF